MDGELVELKMRSEPKPGRRHLEVRLLRDSFAGSADPCHSATPSAGNARHASGSQRGASRPALPSSRWNDRSSQPKRVARRALEPADVSDL